MSCGCKKRCSNDYPCVTNNLNCTDMCSCHACENSLEISVSDEELENEDDYASDDEED